MSKLKIVIQFEVIRTLKKPTFWLSVLAIPALFGIIMGIVYFSGKTSSDLQEAEQSKPFSFAIKDDSDTIPEELLAQYNAETVTNKSLGIQKVKNNEIEAFFYYPKDIANDNIEIYNKHSSILSDSKYTLLANSLLTAAASQQLDSEGALFAIQGNLSNEQTVFRDGEEFSPIGSVIIPGIFLVLFYATIVLLGNQMLASTTEEKENRVTEIILTSITSRTLIIGKIISLVILGFIQIATIVVPAVLIYIFARDALNIPDVSQFINEITINAWQLSLGAGLLISGFLLFTGLLVSIGAAMPTAKEANSFFGFVILLMFVPFYFISLLMTKSDSIVVNGLSYFPLTAPVTMMIRNMFDTISITEGVIGLSIVFIAGVVAISVAVRIFRYGTLEYTNRLSLGDLYKKQ